jgi:hypothetical protein
MVGRFSRENELFKSPQPLNIINLTIRKHFWKRGPCNYPRKEKQETIGEVEGDEWFNFPRNEKDKGKKKRRRGDSIRFNGRGKKSIILTAMAYKEQRKEKNKKREKDSGRTESK